MGKMYQIDFNYGRGRHVFKYHNNGLDSTNAAAVRLIRGRRVRPVNVSVFEYCMKKKEKTGDRRLFFSSRDVRRYRGKS